jgi:hypothetical protein
MQDEVARGEMQEPNGGKNSAEKLSNLFPRLCNNQH